jgi:hypothetical protein
MRLPHALHRLWPGPTNAEKRLPTYVGQEKVELWVVTCLQLHFATNGVHYWGLQSDLLLVGSPIPR